MDTFLRERRAFNNLLLLAQDAELPSRVGEYQGSFSKERPLRQYDKRYFRTTPYELKDEDGNVVGKKESIERIRDFPDKPEIQSHPDIMYRGMSHEAYEDFKRTGRIKSKDTHNIGPEQKGLTYWTTQPETAVTYANSFAPEGHKPSWDRPAYVIASRRPHSSDTRSVKGTGKHEIGVTRPIHHSEVTEVHRGDVVHYDPGEKSHGMTVAPSADLHWKKIPKPTFAESQ